VHRAGGVGVVQDLQQDDEGWLKVDEDWIIFRDPFSTAHGGHSYFARNKGDLSGACCAGPVLRSSDNIDKKASGGGGMV
jgi:hypothetical protein